MAHWLKLTTTEPSTAYCINPALNISSARASSAGWNSRTVAIVCCA